jgi:D-alanyl-D-alanine dipeptidase
VSFEDHHWLISDYVTAINEAGLRLTILDECRPQNSDQIEWDSTFTKQRLLIPTYIVMVCERLQ